MNILDCLESAYMQSGAKNFSYANLSEFNVFVESLGSSQFPTLIIVPPVMTGLISSPFTKYSITLTGWALYHIHEDVSYFRSPQVEGVYISPARDIVDRFVRGLLDSGLNDNTATDNPYTARPEYAFLAQQLFGVSFEFRWNIIKQKAICPC